MNEENKITITKILKLLGLSWVGFSLVAGIIIGNRIGAQLTPPTVETAILDYGPYKEAKEGEPLELEETSKHVAMFRIDGVISASGEDDAAWTRQFCREIEKASDNKSVGAILLEINSPGGEVAASQSIHNAVKAASKKKPVVAYFASTAASGGYYIGCAAPTIITHPESLTGSIGVIIRSTNYSAAFQKVGLETHTFKSGQLKDMLSGARPLEEKEKAYTQSLVDSTYDTFLTLVAETRNLNADELRKEAADGRILKGSDAVKLKLADQTGELPDAIAKARELAKEKSCNVKLYKINRPSGKGLLSLLSQANTNVGVTVNTPGLLGSGLTTTSGSAWSIPNGIPLVIHLP